jgi:hypothetical protein
MSSDALAVAKEHTRFLVRHRKQPSGYVTSSHRIFELTQAIQARYDFRALDGLVLFGDVDMIMDQVDLDNSPIHVTRG